MSLKLALGMMGTDTWHAAEVYVNDLVCALRETYGAAVGLYLLTSGNHKVGPDAASLVDEVVPYPTVRKYTALWALDRGTKLLLSRDVIGEAALKRRGIDVVAFFNAAPKLRMPSLSFIPDFQHLRMPEMFDAGECQRRDEEFMRLARLSAAVVLLSNDAKKDFVGFAPMYAHKVRVIPPVSYIPPRVYEFDPQSISRACGLPDRFVYMPNQFWKHKNHETVFRALAILRDKGVEVIVACSGYPGDNRHPNHFADLVEKLSRWSLRDQVAFLGLLPREHVLALMRQTICVVNPSLFEGFGLTVEEARSVGKQVLLSDITPHREQDPPKAVYFDPRDADDVAQKLSEAWTNNSPGPDWELESRAREMLPQRTRAYAQAFMSVVQEVAGQRARAASDILLGYSDGKEP